MVRDKRPAKILATILEKIHGKICLAMRVGTKMLATILNKIYDEICLAMRVGAKMLATIVDRTYDQNLKGVKNHCGRPAKKWTESTAKT